MPIDRLNRPMAATWMAATAWQLLDASTVCAIATVGAQQMAHVNAAYFAWSPEFDVVWLSEPLAKHSRNVRANDSVGVTVYDSSQTWGGPDHGIQLFGAAHEARSQDVEYAENLYAKRFPDYHEDELSAYRFYLFRPRRLKLFDERTLGGGEFVTARIGARGRLTWERTEIYRSHP